MLLTVSMLTLPQSLWADESSDGLVEVEPTFVQLSRTEGKYELVPYGERRGKWGSQFSIGYSTFNPTNYPSEFTIDPFDLVYGVAEVPLLEVQYNLKRNFSFGAITAEVGMGFYQNSSDTPDVLDVDLQVIPIRLGASLILDQLFKVPYIAPYVSGGIYTMIYKEVLTNLVGDENEKGGNTQVSPYMAFGVQIGLDWLDPVASRISYEDSGIEATFVYVEARKFFEPNGQRDPDFETAFEPNAGIRVEF